MWLHKRIGRNLEQTRALAADVCRFCFTTSAEVVRQGNARLDGLSRLTQVLGPPLHQFANERIRNLQHRLDRLNCALAERAVPRERRDRVNQLKHVLGHPEQHSLYVVRPEPKALEAESKGGAMASRRS